jgi:hypothetical protein
MTVCLSVLAPANGQEPTTPPDANATGALNNAVIIPPDASNVSPDNSSSGLKIRVPDGFGGVTTLPDEMNESERSAIPKVSAPNIDHNK